MDQDSQPKLDAPAPLRSAGSSRRLVAVLLAACCALVTLLVYLFLSAGPRLPEIDQQRLDQARNTWESNAPTDYDIEVSVTGPRAAIYRVEVRDGQALRAWRDGSPLKDERTIGTWSVPGMFDTMQSDVDHIEEPIQISARESHHVSPRALFDPTYGYPQRFRRIEWGSDMEAGWEVTLFQVRD